MKKKILLSILFVLSALVFIISCSKEFENPIDPDLEESIPPMPTDLRAFAATYNSIELSFAYTYQNTIGIIIYRNNKIHDTINFDTSYLDLINIEEESVYSYKVCGYNANGISEFSNIVYDTTLKSPDILSPSLVINSHFDSAIVRDDSIRVSGKVTDLDGKVIGVYLGNPIVDSAVITDSLWYVDIYFDSSNYKNMEEFFFYAIDTAENKTNLFWHLMWDTTTHDTFPPIINFVEPLENYSKFSDSVINLIIKVQDIESGVLFVKVNGLNAGTYNDSIYNKTIKISTNHGDTTNIIITAGDRSSNFNIDTLKWFVVFDSTVTTGEDTDGPFFTVQNGINKIDVDTILLENLILKGTVFDTSGIDSFTVRINGGEIINLGNNGIWTYEFTYTAFTNTMVFEAKDLLGNISKDTVTIYYDFQNEKLKMKFDTANHNIVISWDSYTDIDYKNYKLWVSLDVTADTNAATLIYNSTNSFDSSYEYSQKNDTARYYFQYAMYDSASNVIYHKFFAQYLYAYTRMVTIPAGSYLNIFSISYDYYMDSTEVTQGLYDAIMKDTTYGYSAYVKPDWSAYHGLGNNYAAYNITWYDAVLFCNARSKVHGLDTVYTYTSVSGTPGNACTLTDVSINYSAIGFRLPTEDEWELAYRSGTNTDYYWGKDYDPYPSTLSDSAEISYYAIWNGNSYPEGQKVLQFEVANKLPNANGLYDMSGNLGEYCNGWNGIKPAPRIDYRGDSPGEYRIVCGGAKYSFPNGLQASSRGNFSSDFADIYTGFRCVLVY